MLVSVLRNGAVRLRPVVLSVSALLAVTAPALAIGTASINESQSAFAIANMPDAALDRILLSQQFGQPAGSALDQTDAAAPPAGQPSYGQPAGSALDQNSPGAMVMPPPGQPQAPTNVDRIPQGMPPGVPFSPGTMPPQNAFGQPNQQQPCPIDLTTATLGRLDLELDHAQFQESAVDKLHLIVTDLDLKNGTLSGLDIAVKGGMFRDMAFDQLSIVSQGQMAFNRNELLNNRVLQFAAPVEAQVMAIVSQDSLNRFLNSPETLQRLSVVGAQKMKFLASMLGSNANIGVTLSQANVQLEKGSRVNVAVQAKVGMGTMGMPLPLAVDTKLALNEDGWIALADTHLISNGQEISPLLSQMLVKKFNEMTLWQKSDDIQFRFRELKVVANKQFVVRGTAAVNRLRFGH